MEGERTAAASRTGLYHHATKLVLYVSEDWTTSCSLHARGRAPLGGGRTPQLPCLVAAARVRSVVRVVCSGAVDWPKADQTGGAITSGRARVFWRQASESYRRHRITYALQLSTGGGALAVAAASFPEPF